MQLNGTIQKFEPQSDGSVIIEGVASSPTVDSDGETITADAMRKAIPDYLRWGNVREMHSPSAVGVALDCGVDASGVTRLRAKIIDSEACKKVRAGVYKAFSIGGKVLAKLGNAITSLSLTEISICDRPSNPECAFSIWKAAGLSPATDIEARIEEDIRIWKSAGLPEMEIIKKAAQALADYTNLEFAKLERELRESRRELGEKLDESYGTITGRPRPKTATQVQDDRLAKIKQLRRTGFEPGERAAFLKGARLRAVDYWNDWFAAHAADSGQPALAMALEKTVTTNPAVERFTTEEFSNLTPEEKDRYRKDCAKRSRKQFNQMFNQIP
jgi:hypothetical protein